MIKLDSNFLRGSYPPIVTPFKDGAVDFATFEQLVEYQIAEGSHGIVVTGTTGEPSTLTIAERVALFQCATRIAAGRIPVVAACGTQSHADTIELLAGAEKARVDALLIVTPYFLRPPQRGLVEYYLDLGRRTSLPMMIYHIPGRAAVNMTADSLVEIAEKMPHLIGIKHAVNDLALVTELLERLGFDFRIHVGLEELSFPMLCIGAAGLMNAVGNIAPRQVAELYEATTGGDLARGRALHFALYDLNQAVFFDTNPIPMKYMMTKLGLLAKAEHRLPMMPATPEVARRLDGVLARAKLNPRLPASSAA